MEALKHSSLKEGVYNHQSFHHSISHPQYPDYNYMIVEGNDKDYMLIIAHPSKGIIQKAFRLVEKEGHFYYLNGGQTLFDSLDDIIIYMIKRYAIAV